jgi:hypothetical protein
MRRFVKPTVDKRSSTPLHLQRRLLVIDDERDTVPTLMELLRDQGHETRGLYKSRCRR